MKILHIELDSAMGGIESFLLNVYKNIERDKVQFDFVEYGPIVRGFDSSFTELGATIYKLSDRRKNPIKTSKELFKLLKSTQYDAVHIHKNSLLDISAIRICQKANIPVIIVHSHNTNRDNNIVVFIHKLNRKFFDVSQIYCFACSKKAAEWMFGKKNRSVSIIFNGIDTKKFGYCEGIRSVYRSKLNLVDTFVIGNVGRLTEQKNPLFLLNILKYLLEKSLKIKLLWVGDGALRDKFEKLIYKLGIEENVIMTGKVSNPEYYYQAMDLFVMPSLYEGFPIAAVEAQSAGLSCLLSSSITQEANLTSNIEFLELSLGEKKWAEAITKKIHNKNVRISNDKLLREKGFDIKDTAYYLQNFYMKHNK